MNESEFLSLAERSIGELGLELSLDTGRPFVSPIYLSTASEDFCLTLAVPLADGQGRFDGALVADINIGALAALLRREAAPA